MTEVAPITQAFNVLTVVQGEVECFFQLGLLPQDE